ncbi:MAG: AbrB/MazE/SpoVT family DNA-binding domain-containing protein [Candidatus Marinimicrobia bacterium]|nr:AbrB/MazE/SpoVT family DNA-binding domain-containing protein [Candidatus Neomarinimicrobiota bacterium]
MIRKIVRVGASLCILLPKDVIKAMEWDFGDPIDLILDEENEKVVLRNPREEEQKKKTYLEDFNEFLEDYKSVLLKIDPVDQISD